MKIYEKSLFSENIGLGFKKLLKMISTDVRADAM